MTPKKPFDFILPKQITPGFLEFFDERKCRVWLLNSLHHGQINCPKCQTRQDLEHIAEKFYSLQRIRCAKCESRFNALSRTVMSGTKLDARQIVLLFVLKRAGVQNRTIAKLAGVSESTACRWGFVQQALDHTFRGGPEESCDLNDLAPDHGTLRPWDG